jgi:ABC-type uncharacterized transport system ATPase subunit
MIEINQIFRIILSRPVSEVSVGLNRWVVIVTFLSVEALGIVVIGEPEDIASLSISDISPCFCWLLKATEAGLSIVFMLHYTTKRRL